MFKKYGHSLGPEALEFLEELIEQHDISDEDVEFSTEWIAKEYNKQDGESDDQTGLDADSDFRQTRR